MLPAGEGRREGREDPRRQKICKWGWAEHYGSGFPQENVPKGSVARKGVMKAIFGTGFHAPIIQNKCSGVNLQKASGLRLKVEGLGLKV
jgi:hypothetical protein